MNKYTDQEFTYRETPVSYDGIAKVSLKGNTVAWNQLAKPLNSSNYGSVRATATYSNDVCTITTTSANTICGIYISSANFGAVVGHKYLFMCTVNPSITRTFRLGLDSITTTADELSVTANKDNLLSIVQTATQSDAFVLYLRCNAVGDTATIKNVMAIDLTMLGMDDVTDKASFQKYFSLPYYSYNQGTLVNFNGNGIKTTGASRVVFADGTRTGVGVTAVVSNGVFSASGTATSTYANLCYFNEFKTKQGEIYTVGLNKPLEYSIVFRFAQATSDTVYQQITVPTGSQVVSFTANNDYNYVRLYISALTVGTVVSLSEMIPMIAHAKLTEYEPYKETITDLPTLTYFPNGLKSAGNVYDELTPSKAVTRVGSVDLGTLTWAYNSSGQGRFESNGIASLVKRPPNNATIPNILCSIYDAGTTDGLYSSGTGISIRSANGYIWAVDPSQGTDATAFKQMLTDKNVVLNYELASPTEQDINADLYYKFYGDGTEEILPNALMNGSVDLGSLNWTYSSADTSHPLGFFYSTSLANRKSGTTNLMCDKFVTTTSWATDKSIQGNANNYAIYIVDSDFTDATAFKNSLQGVMLWYEKSDSTPTTSAFFGDITYYNTYESEVPYRKFWLVNGNGERWNFTENELKTFLNNPNGLGFKKALDLIRYGERAVKNSEVYDLPTVTGDLLFYDTANSSRYDRYNEFVRFLMDQPIKLYYQIPVSYSSQIADLYTLDCEVSELRKTESKPEGLLTSNITINGLSFYEGEEVVISGSSTTISIENKGDFAVGFELTIEGTMTNPYFTLEQDEELYGEGRFVDSTAFNSVYVNSNDGEQDLVLQQNGSILPNPLSYQDLSISNGAIYVTFVKLARGVSELKVRGGTISNVTVRFKPMFRSV